MAAVLEEMAAKTPPIDTGTLRGDLREIARDVGDLTNVAARNLRQRNPLGGWLQRAAGIDLASQGGREQAFAALRDQRERSASAVRATVRDHPMGAAVGALAVGLAVAWILTRSSHRR